MHVDPDLVQLAVGISVLAEKDREGKLHVKTKKERK